MKKARQFCLVGCIRSGTTNLTMALHDCYVHVQPGLPYCVLQEPFQVLTGDREWVIKLFEHDIHSDNDPDLICQNLHSIYGQSGFAGTKHTFNSICEVQLKCIIDYCVEYDIGLLHIVRQNKPMTIISRWLSMHHKVWQIRDGNDRDPMLNTTSYQALPLFELIDRSLLQEGQEARFRYYANKAGANVKSICFESLFQSTKSVRNDEFAGILDHLNFNPDSFEIDKWCDTSVYLGKDCQVHFQEDLEKIENWDEISTFIQHYPDGDTGPRR